MTKKYIGEVGTEILLDTGILIGSATSYYIKTKDPTGTVGTFAASLYDSFSTLAGATGTYFLKYALVSGNITVPGDWKFQAFIGTNAGTWYGEMVKVTLYDAFQ